MVTTYNHNQWSLASSRLLARLDSTGHSCPGCAGLVRLLDDRFFRPVMLPRELAESRVNPPDA